MIPILLFLMSCYEKKAEKTGLEGKPLPEFSLLLADSVTWLNTKQIPTKEPLVIFLFSPDCPYSKEQMTEIVENIDELKGVHIYAITPFSYRKMTEFSKKYNIQKYKNITIGRDTSNFFAHFMGVNAVPYIAIYNKEKILDRVFIGITDTKIIKATKTNL